jgi:hypothetical protein
MLQVNPVTAAGTAVPAVINAHSAGELYVLMLEYQSVRHITTYKYTTADMNVTMKSLSILATCFDHIWLSSGV